MTDDYCKLASGIILSTIWREDDHTRLLWVTMLAVKGRDHRVRASVPGLAAVANIPLASCRAGLVKLMEPDPDSRTKEHEGRRIAEVEDGWLILNGEKYRNFLSKQERNEYQAKLMAERRAVAKAHLPLAPVSRKLAQLGQAEAEAEAEVPPPKEHTPRKSAPPAGIVEGKDSILLPTTTQSKRIATLFHRRLTTAWSEDEVKAYKKIGTVPEEDLVALERYYGANWPATRGVNMLRTDLLTLLNNFPGEVGRAHASVEKGQSQQAPAAVKGHV